MRDRFGKSYLKKAQNQFNAQDQFSNCLEKTENRFGSCLERIRVNYDTEKNTVCKYKVLSNKQGQITVFLALLFLVLISFCLFIIQGVQSYSVSALGEDAIKNAGENVLANYDRELFKEYHLFFLDPRERNYMLSDGKTAVNQYFSKQSFFSLHCDSLAITEEKTAVDEDGLYLKHQIREWMKYREEQKVEDVLKQLIKNVEKGNVGRQQYEKEVQDAENDSVEKEMTAEKETDTEKAGESSENSENRKQNQPEGENKVESKKPESQEQQNKQTDQNEDTQSPEVQQERIAWKEIKETLQLLMKTGILFYVADKPEQLSKRTISEGNLPSKEKKVSGLDKEQNEMDKAGENSFSGLKGIKSLFSVDFSVNKNTALWTKENYIVPYIEECFWTYGDTLNKKSANKNNAGKRDDAEKALFYETEYLISGRNSDLENLKRVANYILLLRFINNYAFTGRDAGIKAQVDTMASALAGVLGVPQTTKGIQMLIRAAMSYGESLLEVHTLFTGGEIPMIKNKANWNLELKTMARQLKEKKPVKKGKQNVSYKDYLKMLLFIRGSSKVLCYRMMDIMQENVACKENGFLMRNCLFSYKWKSKLSMGTVQMNFVKQNSY